VLERAARLAPRCESVCLIGPECTGKTTLAERLAAHFGASWVPEFAREYALRVERALTVEDAIPIALGEMALLDAAADGGLLILDTDLISTVVYSRYYYGSCPEWIEREALSRRADFYLLMDIDVPWADDAVRDSADSRIALFGQFVSALAEFGASVVKIGGSWEERFAAAVREISSRDDAKTFTRSREDAKR
jgi:NadR type nicotinamide-nucleotide adenylyltransferase